MGGDITSKEFRRLNSVIRRKRQERTEELISKAFQKAQAIASLLKNRYGAERVFLYGSLACGGFREGSDIDILVEGFQGSYWKMYTEAEDLASPFNVSIALYEDAAPSLREAALKGGMLL
ncbi:MAG TPA: nucleotidyltransferase domain-containing protein [Firmicutes bacterium]|nr:nucleotidyltransferase domain-containing protein [Bacillota bacterium]HHY98284.1 nucleotidyltransferase domain-containing protein [Bacillota bacterium]